MSNKFNTLQRPIKSMFVAGSITLASGLVAMMAGSASAATLFGFDNILGGDPVGDSFNGNYSFEVLQQTSSQVLFNFANAGVGSIIQIYWNFGSNSGILDTPSIQSQSSGVSFSINNPPPGPNELPQGNIIAFVSEEAVGANNPVSPNGIGGGESLGVLFNGNYSQVLNALNTGDLRLGIHVQSLPNGGGSDSYVSQAVPEPLTILGALTAVGFGAAFKRRSTKTED